MVIQHHMCECHTYYYIQYTVQANKVCNFAFITCVLHAAHFSLTQEGFPAQRVKTHRDRGGKGRRRDL